MATMKSLIELVKLCYPTSNNVIKRNYRAFGRKSEIIKKFGRYDIVKPGIVSEMKTIPKHIIPPEYYFDFTLTGPMLPEIKIDNQIEGLKYSCKLARYILNKVGKKVKVGMTTDDIDVMVHELCILHNAFPSPLNYMGYPKSVCTSVNNVAVHGVPDNRRLRSGDIINIDVTVYVGGYHGDCSSTFLIGRVDKKGRHLVEVTREALYQAIAVCGHGQSFSAIGETVEKVAHAHGFNVMPWFLGHGIGTYFHGPPEIHHSSLGDYPGRMCAGMTFTIEPVLTQGSIEVDTLEDGWTIVSKDGARSAQFEETVLITADGVEILTK